MPRRFVVLLHECPQGDHWDLMLENGESLTTWALPAQHPPEAFTCSAEALPDHRLAYLEYEGPVSGDRGRVRRIDRGTYDVVEPGSYFLDGIQMSGKLSVESDGRSENGVVIRYIPLPDDALKKPPVNRGPRLR